MKVMGRNPGYLLKYFLLSTKGISFQIYLRLNPNQICLDNSIWYVNRSFTIQTLYNKINQIYPRLIWLKTPIDVIAILSQLSGALAWPILQWSGNYQAEVRLSHPWALPAGLLLGKRIKKTKQRILFSSNFFLDFL